MKRAMSLVIFSFQFFAFLSCSYTKERKVESSLVIQDTTLLKQAISEAQQKFMDAFRDGDSVTVAEGYTEDGKIMNAGMPSVSGRQNLVHFFGTIFRSGQKRITTQTLGVWPSNNLIVEEGKWTMAEGDGKEYDHGKYLILWREEGGKWKKYRDCHNSDIYPK